MYDSGLASMMTRPSPPAKFSLALPLSSHQPSQGSGIPYTLTHSTDMKPRFLMASICSCIQLFDSTQRRGTREFSIRSRAWGLCRPSRRPPPQPLPKHPHLGCSEPDLALTSERIGVRSLRIPKQPASGGCRGPARSGFDVSCRVVFRTLFQEFVVVVVAEERGGLTLRRGEVALAFPFFP